MSDIDAIRAERDELRRIIDSETPIGALDLATTWRAERAHLQAEIAALQLDSRQIDRARMRIMDLEDERNALRDEVERLTAIADDGANLASQLSAALLLSPVRMQNDIETARALVRYVRVLVNVAPALSDRILDGIPMEPKTQKLIRTRLANLFLAIRMGAS